MDIMSQKWTGVWCGSITIIQGWHLLIGLYNSQLILWSAKLVGYYHIRYLAVLIIT